LLSLLCLQGVNTNDLARTVYSGIPDDVIFIDLLASQPRRQAGLPRPGFHFDRSLQQNVFF
jgi:hypothetical protein